MFQTGRLSLSTVVDVDVGWDGVGRVTRLMSIESVGQGAVDVSATKIEVLIPSRDVLNLNIGDDVGGKPYAALLTDPGGTLLKLWPGIISIEDSTYQMTVTYRQIDFASRFETGRLIYLSDLIEAGDVEGTEFSSRQPFTYRVLLPKRAHWGSIPDYRHAVERYHNALRARTKDRRELLEWEWVAEANDRPKRLRALYIEKPRARLLDLIKQVGVGLVTLILGAVGTAVKPEAAIWIRHVLGIP